MAQNTSPIFLGSAKVSWILTNTTGITSTDGTDANVKLVFTADATDGSKIDYIKVRYSGATGAATVLRFWVNNGATAATATNNTLIHELTIANLAALSQTADNGEYIWNCNLALPAGYRIYCAAGTNITNALAVSAVGGDY